MQYDPDFDKVILYCPFSEPDGDFKDYSSNGFVIPKSTTVQTPQVNDYCGYFNSLGVRYGAYTADMDLNSMAQYTVEFWFIQYTNAAAARLVSSGGANAWNTTTGEHFHISAINGKQILYRISITASPYYTDVAMAPYVHGKWNHVAITKNSTDYSLFLNGNLVSRTTVSNASRPSGNPPGLDVGFCTGEGVYYKGYMRDLRITRNVCRYTTSFIPPVNLKDTILQDPYFNYVILLVPFYSATDRSSTLPTDMSNSARTPSLISGSYLQHTNAGLYGAHFDGSTSTYTTLSWNLPGAYQFGYDDFTIECYIKLNTVGTTTRCIVSQYTNYSTLVGFYFAVDTTARLIVRLGNNVPVSFASTDTIAALTWTHVAVTRASGVTRLFINGVVQSTTSSASTFISNMGYLRIGANCDATPVEYLNGIIRDLRITRRLARYTTSFTPPTTLAGRISGMIQNPSEQPLRMKVVAANEYSKRIISGYSDALTGEYSLIVPPVKHLVGVVPTDGSDVMWKGRVNPS